MRIIGSGFTDPIRRGCLPASLTMLIIEGRDYNCSISDGALPNSITDLTLAAPMKTISCNTLPASLTSLRIGVSFRQELTRGFLPNSLTRLQIYNDNEGAPRRLQSGVLPNSLRYLIGFPNCPVADVICSLAITHLRFDSSFNQPLLPGMLSSSLRELEMGYNFNKPLVENVLPPALILKLSFNFNQPISAEVLPESLTELTFSGRFNQSLLAGVLPSSLRILRFGGEYFNQPIADDVLPATLQRLVLLHQYNHPLPVGSYELRYFG